MRRTRLLLSLLIGGVAGTILGLAGAIAADASFFSFASAVLASVLACRIAGVRDGQLVAKIALYAAIGWVLTFALGPATSQSAESRAQRLAEDPLVGDGWLVACHAVSILLASVGAVFAPADNESPGTSKRDHLESR